MPRFRIHYVPPCEVALATGTAERIASVTMPLMASETPVVKAPRSVDVQVGFASSVKDSTSNKRLSLLGVTAILLLG